LARGWNALLWHENARMTDATLVAVVLVIGGGLFLAIFLWITAQRVKEIGPPKPPPDHHH